MTNEVKSNQKHINNYVNEHLNVRVCYSEQQISLFLKYLMTNKSRGASTTLYMLWHGSPAVIYIAKHYELNASLILQVQEIL